MKNAHRLFLLLFLPFSAFGQNFAYCHKDYPYRQPPWRVKAAKCYLVNSAVTSSGGGRDGKVKPGMHQNLLCRVTFVNGETGEEVTVDMTFGYGGLDDDYRGHDLGGHGVDGEKPIPPGDFWSIIDRLCAAQQAIDASIRQGYVCYNLLGGGFWGCFSHNLASFCTLKWGDIGKPTYNCRDAACYLWDIIPKPAPPPAPPRVPSYWDNRRVPGP